MSNASSAAPVPRTPPILLDLPTQFSTDRLLIRAPQPGDGAVLNAAVRESWDDLSRWLPWAKQIPTVEQSEALMRDAAAKWLRRDEFWLLLFEKASGELVGSSGLHPKDWDVPRFETGYWVRSRYAGRGFMTEAVRAITAFAVQRLGARRVQLHLDTRNDRSRRVAERAGFTCEGRQHRMLIANDGTLADIEHYAFLP